MQGDLSQPSMKKTMGKKSGVVKKKKLSSKGKKKQVSKSGFRSNKQD